MVKAELRLSGFDSAPAQMCHFGTGISPSLRMMYCRACESSSAVMPGIASSSLPKIAAWKFSFWHQR